LYPSAADLRKQWADPTMRAEIISKLEERGIDFDQLRSSSNQPEADPFDLLCHLAFNGPLRTRRERADRVKKEEKSFFEKYGPESRAISSPSICSVVTRTNLTLNERILRRQPP